MKERKSRIRIFGMFVLLVVGCAPVAPPPGAPKAEGPQFPPPGSSWVMTETATGSYGSGVREVTFRFLGDRTWQGRKLLAFTDGEQTTYVDAQRRLIARARGTTPSASFDPHYVAYGWPLFAGRKWSGWFSFADHERGRSFDNVQYGGKVEDFEVVKTPAGPFKTFKIALGTQSTKFVLWWAPDLGIIVKSRAERFSTSYRGAGSRDRELVSYDIKR